MSADVDAWSGRQEEELTNRITMRVDGESSLLAQGQDSEAIERNTVAAARTGPEMVTVTVVGNRQLDVLVSPGVPITFITEQIEDDDRDDGDLEAPYDEHETLTHLDLPPFDSDYAS